MILGCCSSPVWSFAMCPLGFRFAPRIRDLKEKRLYVLPGMTVPPELASLVAGTINLRARLIPGQHKPTGLKELRAEQSSV
jgi:TnpA family transposase